MKFENLGGEEDMHQGREEAIWVLAGIEHSENQQNDPNPGSPGKLAILSSLIGVHAGHALILRDGTQADMPWVTLTVPLPRIWITSSFAKQDKWSRSLPRMIFGSWRDRW